MGLTKYKLGELIKPCELKNDELKYGILDVKGISIQKIFIETKANMEGVSLEPYYLVQPDDFAYVTVTSRNGEKITLAHNTTDETYIISSSYIVFRVNRTDLLLSDYLFIYFNRSEFDRYSRYNSWGSAREMFSWEDMCDMDIELPSLEIQQKYVDIYNAMLANQQNYERGLDDLKLVCDGYFDAAKKKNIIKLGQFIEKSDKRNINSQYVEDDVRGITNKKVFDDTKANLSGIDITKFKVVNTDEFAYNSRTDGRDMLVIALNKGNPVIVTFNYNVFRIKSNQHECILPDYLYAYFKRSEFDRLVRFNSWGSSQELLSWEELCNIEVPFPSVNEQKSIIDINNVYINRKEINEKLKEQIKDICPILIKGSIEEARKAGAV